MYQNSAVLKCIESAVKTIFTRRMSLVGMNTNIRILSSSLSRIRSMIRCQPVKLGGQEIPCLEGSRGKRRRQIRRMAAYLAYDTPCKTTANHKWDKSTPWILLKTCLERTCGRNARDTNTCYTRTGRNEAHSNCLRSVVIGFLRMINRRKTSHFYARKVSTQCSCEHQLASDAT